MAASTGRLPNTTSKDVRYPGIKAFTDFTINCQDVVFKVHKVILVTGSTFFEKALGSGFKEATTGTMDLHDEDPDLLGIVLAYLYHRHDEGHFEIVECENRLMQFALLYALCDRLDQQKLKNIAKDDFSIALNADFANDDFCGVINEVYASTPDSDRGLRDLVVAIVTKHHDQISSNEGFFKMMETNGYFGRDLAKAFVGWKSPVSETRYFSPYCRKIFKTPERIPNWVMHGCSLCQYTQLGDGWAAYVR